jgi:hypothetical protein
LWEKQFAQETKIRSVEQEGEESSGNQKQIQRIHYKLSEISSLVTIILSKILGRSDENSSSSSNFDPEINSNHEFILTATIICEFLVEEWKFALDQFASVFETTTTNMQSLKNQLSGDLTSILEMCDGCLNRISGKTGKIADKIRASLNKIKEMTK